MSRIWGNTLKIGNIRQNFLSLTPRERMQWNFSPQSNWFNKSLWHGKRTQSLTQMLCLKARLNCRQVCRHMQCSKLSYLHRKWYPAQCHPRTWHLAYAGLCTPGRTVQNVNPSLRRKISCISSQCRAVGKAAWECLCSQNLAPSSMWLCCLCKPPVDHQLIQQARQSLARQLLE